MNLPKNLIRIHLVDIKYITEDSLVEFRYLGKLRQFRVEKIRAGNDGVKEDARQNETTSGVYVINRDTSISFVPFEQV
jgi:hypothetical protein